MQATENKTDSIPDYMNAKEASAYIAVSGRHFARLKARGQIPFARLSPHCVRFRRSDLDRMMRKMTVGAE